MSTPIEQFQAQRIIALENEITRLNNCMSVYKTQVEIQLNKLRASDPVYLKPLNDLEVDYEIVSKGN